MSWRLPAALLAVTGLIAGSMLVSLQIEDGLAHALTDRDTAETPVDRPTDETPYRLRDLVLPEDLPMDLPEGTQIPDPGTIRFPDGAEVELPPGFDPGTLDLDVPPGTRLELPPGTVFDPNRLDLPEGATVHLPDGERLNLPAGSSLDLPPELVESLLDQGVTPGVLDETRDVRMPAHEGDAGLGFNPPALPDGGTLQLPPGSELRLPDGATAPYPPGTTMPMEAPWRVPAGTEIAAGLSAAAGFAGADGDPATPRPGGSGSQDPNAEPRPRSSGRAVDTDIDRWSREVRKGEPFTVGGYVRDAATGEPLEGVTVDVYLNETKQSAGTPLGTAVSDAQGRFEGEFTFPTDAPARDYQLVNRARAHVAADGTAYAEGWGDPPFRVVSGTHLDLDVPDQALAYDAVPARVTLRDEADAPVANARVELHLDGTLARTVRTDGDGRATWSYRADPGETHRVDAYYRGSDHYEGSEAHARTEVTDAVLDVATESTVLRGSTLTFDGRVIEDGAPAAGVDVRLEVLGDTHRVRTGGDGRFQAAVHVPASTTPGAHPVTYRVDEYGLEREAVLHVTAPARLDLEAPAWAPAGGRVEVRVDVYPRDGAPFGTPVPVILEIHGPKGTVRVPGSAADGRAATFDLPLADRGLHVLDARLADDHRFDGPATHAHELRLGDLEVTVDAPATTLRDTSTSFEVRVTFDGEPVMGALLSGGLEPDGDGVSSPLKKTTTDDAGAATLTHMIPADAPVGTHVWHVRAALTNDTRIPGADPTAPVAQGEAGASGTLRVIAQTHLTAEVVEQDAGGAATVRLRLVDGAGDPVADAPIALRLEGDPDATVMPEHPRTDAAGEVRVRVNATDAVGLHATYAGTDTHLPSTANATVATAGLRGQPVGGAFWGRPWLWAPVAAVGAAAAGAVALRRRHRAAPAAGPAVPVAAGPTPDVAFPDVADDLPHVWGVGEPLRVAVHAEGATEARVRVDDDGDVRTVRLDEGAGTLEVVREDAAHVTLTVEADGYAPARVPVRFVAYRREISEGFDRLLAAARDIDPDLGMDATPREMAWVLIDRLGSAAAPALDTVAAVMEAANFTEQPVDRDDYVRFLRATREALARIDEAVGEAPG